MVYESVEYLDNSLIIENDSDPAVNDRLNSDEILTVRSGVNLTKVILHLVLYINIVVTFLKNIFAELSAVIEKNKILNAENKKLESEMNNLEKSLSRMYNQDQLHMMKKNLRRPRAWSDETILKSLKYKFACKKGGYNFIRNQGHPLPSTRVLRSRLQGIDFNPGILEDVFLFLKEKVNSFNEFEKECLLIVDEVSIIEGIFKFIQSN